MAIIVTAELLPLSVYLFSLRSTEFIVHLLLSSQASLAPYFPSAANSPFCLETKIDVT